MKRKILSLITAVSMILSLIILPQTASAYSDGSGTEKDPYLISTAAELQSLAEAVNGGANQRDKYFKMTQDIDLSDVCGADINGSEVSWTPIGIHNSYEFGGTFDGDGHKIKNLYIKSNESYHSLFSVNNGTIKNLSVSGIINGDQYIGGVCALNCGTIENCSSSVSISGSNQLGGVCGSNSSGKISKCYNTGTITSTGGAGGVSGRNDCGTIDNCYNTGSVSGATFVGGICATNVNSGATVQNCYNTGNVTCTGSNVGGISAYNGSSGSTGTVTSCYYLEGTASNAGGGTALSAENFNNQDSFSGWAFDTIWTMSTVLGRPVLIDNNEEHKHTLCGIDGCTDANHDHEEKTFTAWTKTDSLPETVGNYYLTKDVELSEQWSVPTGTVNLCLNGYSIMQKKDNANTINIPEGATLNLCNCKTGGAITHAEGINGRGVYNYGGTFNMYSGKITNNKITGYEGGGVFNHGGTFNMYGGAITDNASAQGGGVDIIANGTFTMRGGEIKSNTADYGGGVDNTGTFNIYGGSITDNAVTSSGGGICNIGTFNMHGGSVTGNIANFYGGGVYSTKTFNMRGGSVTGNTADLDGGGVYSNGTMKISGKPVITGNTKGSADNNVYLCEYYDGSLNPWEPVNPDLYKSRLITIDGALTEGAQIDVTTKTVPTNNVPVDITGANDADYSGYFHSDNDEFEIKNTNDVVQLAVKPPHKHPLCGAECSGHDENHEAVEWTPLTSQDNNLYIDGEAISGSGSYYILPEGNYYLAVVLEYK